MSAKQTKAQLQAELDKQTKLTELYKARAVYLEDKAQKALDRSKGGAK